MDAFLKRKDDDDVSTKNKTKADDGGEIWVVPWVEKYRPRQVEDIVYQDEVVAVLKQVLMGKDLPNLLFYGPPGTGKTSAAISMCRQLFRNKDTFADRVLELNASDERGINVVRNRIKDFARKAVSSHLPDGSPVVSLKVIILDEADAMTAPAQAALRRTMERESRTTRFFLICNYLCKIIPPLTSRCARFRFKPLPPDNQRERLKLICEKENVPYDSESVDQLIELCGGDLRRSITCLQIISSCHKKLSAGEVAQLLGAIPQEVVKKFIEVCKMCDYKELFAYANQIRKEAISVYQLIEKVFDLCIQDEDFTDLQKAAISSKLAICEYRLVDGADEHMQLLDLGSTILEQCKISH